MESNAGASVDPGPGLQRLGRYAIWLALAVIYAVFSCCTIDWSAVSLARSPWLRMCGGILVLLFLGLVLRGVAERMSVWLESERHG